MWECFTANGILTLPDMTEISHRLKKPHISGSDTTFLPLLIMDGVAYIFEFVTQDRYRRIVYVNPSDQFKYFPEVEELERVTNIIRIITENINAHLF